MSKKDKKIEELTEVNQALIERIKMLESRIMVLSERLAEEKWNG